MSRINKRVWGRCRKEATVLTITVGHIQSYIHRETRAEREKVLGLSQGHCYTGYGKSLKLFTMITHTVGKDMHVSHLKTGSYAELVAG